MAKGFNLKINKKYLIVLGIALLFLLIFKQVFFIVVLSILSFIISYIINNLRIKTIGLELVTLSAVLTGKVYGSFLGMVVGLILMVFHLFMSGYMGLYILWVLPSYGLIGILAGIFSHVNIISLGISLTILLNVIYLSFTFIMTPGRVPKLLPYSITNIIINIIFFTSIGNILVSLMK
ncbi:hypothetical protein GF327_09735 [Candidatus Woesearchaeota archaeon]|nr:hypothetical protein [Candidatus Woesearchaeota archaeon]